MLATLLGLTDNGYKLRQTSKQHQGGNMATITNTFTLEITTTKGVSRLVLVRHDLVQNIVEFRLKELSVTSALNFLTDQFAVKDLNVVNAMLTGLERLVDPGSLSIEEVVELVIKQQLANPKEL